MRTWGQNHTRIAAFAAIAVAVAVAVAAAPRADLYEKDGRILAPDIATFHAAWATAVSALWSGASAEDVAAGPGGVAHEGATYALDGCGPALLTATQAQPCAIDSHGKTTRPLDDPTRIAIEHALRAKRLYTFRHERKLSLIAPLTIDDSCLKCHSTLKVGDTFGALHYLFSEAHDD